MDLSVTHAQTLNELVSDAWIGALLRAQKDPEVARKLLVVVDAVNEGDCPSLYELKDKLGITDQRRRYVTQLPPHLQDMSPRDLFPFQEGCQDAADAFYGSGGIPRFETVADMADWPEELLLEVGLDPDVIKVAKQQLAIHGIRLISYAKKVPGDKWIQLDKDRRVLRSRVGREDILALPVEGDAETSLRWRARGVFMTIGEMLALTKKGAAGKLWTRFPDFNVEVLYAIVHRAGLHFAEG